MAASHNTGVHGRFITAIIAALFGALPFAVFAQSSPLTVQPSTGRVGVGTTTPNAKIEAKGTDVGVSVMNNAGTQNYYIGIKDSDGNKLYLGRGRDPSQGVAPAVTVDATDKVGIGTTSPAYKLDVAGTVNATTFRGDGSQLTNLPGGGGGNAALDKVTANTTISGSTTAETTLYSFSVPGGNLGANSLLRLTIQISDLTVYDGDNFVLRFKYGGTTLASVTIGNSSETMVGNARGMLSIVIAGDGATNEQIGSMVFHANSSTLGTSFVQGTSAVDSTATQTLAVTFDWANWAGFWESITLGYAILEKVS